MKKLGASRSVEDRRIHAIRVEKFHQEAEQLVRAAQVRRADEEERLLKKLIDEAFKLELEALRDMQRMKRDEDAQIQKKKEIQTESKRKYLRDQMEMLTEELSKVKLENQIREKAKREVYCRNH